MAFHSMALKWGLLTNHLHPLGAAGVERAELILLETFPMDFDEDVGCTPGVFKHGTGKYLLEKRNIYNFSGYPW